MKADISLSLRITGDTCPSISNLDQPGRVCMDLVWCVLVAVALAVSRAALWPASKSPRGPSFQALILLGGVRFNAWVSRHPSLGDFWGRQAHLGYSPALGTTKKRPCATFARLVGRMKNISTPICFTLWSTVLSVHGSGRVYSGCVGGWSRCSLTSILDPQWCVSLGFNLPWSGLVYCLVPEAPTSPEAFLKLPDGSGPWPCARKHLKRPCALLVRIVGRSTNTAWSAPASCKGFSADCLVFVPNS